MNEMIRLYDYAIFEGMCYALWQHYSANVCIIDNSILKTNEEQGVLVKALRYYIDTHSIRISTLSENSWYYTVANLLK